MKTLGDVKVGESSTIVKLHGEGALRRHLMDLGLIKGTSFKVVKVAPLGDPVEINVRGYELSIRKDRSGRLISRECLIQCHICSRRPEYLQPVR